MGIQSLTFTVAMSLSLSFVVHPGDAVHADPAKPVDPGVGAQVGKDLATSSGRDSKTARTPRLAQVSAATAELPAGGPVDAVRPAAGPAVAPLHLQLGTKTEGHALGSTPAAYRPSAAGDGATKAANVGHPHRTTLARFKPGQPCEHASQVDEVARSWKTNLKWDAIVIDGYGAKGQHSADQIRGCLIHRGVPADYVVASGHDGDETRAATLEVSVTTCDGVTIPCRETVAAPAAPAATK